MVSGAGSPKYMDAAADLRASGSLIFPKFLAIGFIIALATVTVTGADPARAGQAVNVTVENDFFAPREGGVTDRYYSSAIQVSFEQSEADLSVLGLWLGRSLFGDEGQRDFTAERFAIAHSFFTPDNITVAESQPKDHPWAGWLRTSYDISVRHRETVDTLHLSLGVVGPLAQAEPLQREWHRFIDDPLPEGWDNQLGNEVTLQFAWQRTWPAWSLFKAPSDSGQRGTLAADVRPVTRVALGNAFVQASAGAELRLGHNLRVDGGAPRHGAAALSTGFFEPRKDGPGWYVFASAHARGVGRNLFIEGNTFRDSPGVDPERFVHDVSAGVVVESGRVRFSYSYVSRSDEFKGQEGRHNFGLMGIAVAL